MGNKLVVLIVDDHTDVLISLGSFFETLPHVTTLSANSFGRAAVWIEAENRIDLVVANVRLKGEFNGLHVAELTAASHPDVAVMMMSGEERSRIRGLPDHFALIQKPFGVEAMLKHVDDAFVRRHESFAAAQKNKG